MTEVDNEVDIEERVESAAKINQDLEHFETSLKNELAVRNKTCKIMGEQLSELRKKYAAMETGAALEDDESNMDVLVKKANKQASSNDVETALAEEREMKQLQHALKKKKAAKIKTMSKLEMQMFQKQKNKEQIAAAFEIDHDVDAEDLARIKADKAKEEKEAKELEQLEADVTKKLEDTKAKRDRMLQEGSLRSDQIKLLKDKIALQENERSDLEKRILMIESQYEAERQAREELERVQENLVVQKQEAEGGYKLLLNELKLSKSKFVDEKNKRIQTEGQARALEKQKQNTEEEKQDAVKKTEQLKKSKEQLAQETMDKEKQISQIAADKAKAEQEAQEKLEALQLQMSSQSTQSQEKILQMSKELDARTEKLRQEMEDMKSKHILVTGCEWIKHCAHKKEPRFVWVSDDLSHLQWQSTKKKVRAGEKVDKKFIEVKTISKVLAKTFAPSTNNTPADAAGKKLRALHLIAITCDKRDLTLEMPEYTDADKDKWNTWVKAFQFLVRNRK